MRKNQRMHERKVLSQFGNADKAIYVTNTMSDFIIDNYLSVSHKKVSEIKDTM